MNKAELKGIRVSADDTMITALRLSPLSGRTSKVAARMLQAFIPEAPTGELSKNATTVKKSEQLLTADE